MNKIKHSKGYILVSVPEHPYSNSDGYVPEHRLVIEKKIKRYVNPLREDVHHINEVVDDNRLANLVLLTKKEHRRTHAGWELKNGEWYKTCNTCKRFLKVDGNFYRRRTQHNEYVSQCHQCLREVRLRINRQTRILRVCHSCRKGVISMAQNPDSFICRSCAMKKAWDSRRR